MDEKKSAIIKDKVRAELEKLENLDIQEISDSDLDSVSGGQQEGVSCNSLWCCSNVKPADPGTTISPGNPSTQAPISGTTTTIRGGD